jgi:hypothetical protein
VAIRNQTKPLRISISADQRHHSQLEPLLSHLFPKETPKLKSTATTTAKAQQANKHDDQQNNIGGKQDDERNFAVLNVGNNASPLQRCPYSFNLRMDKARGRKN